MKKLILFLFAVILLSACETPKFSIPAFMDILFIDYEDIRSHGVEVTSGDPPQNAIPLGSYSEIVCYGRLETKVRDFEMGESDAFQNNVVAKKKKTEILKIGDEESDLRKLDKDIADAIKQLGGDGIANLTVKETTTTDIANKIVAPIYHIDGVIYRNK